MTDIKSHKYTNGSVGYFHKDTNIIHREDGPAIEYADGSKGWFISLRVMEKKSKEELLEWLLCHGDKFPKIEREKIKMLIREK